MDGNKFELRQFEGHPGLAWRERMDRHNVSQAQMARQTDTSPKHINQILQGNALPSAELVVKMARVLHDDDHAAHGEAWLMFQIQGRHLIQQAFTDLKEWTPHPDWRRRRFVEEGEQ